MQLIFRSSHVASLAAAIALLGATPAPAVPAPVAQSIAQITSQPMYAHSTWGFRVVDIATGQVLMDDMGSQMFVAGSIMKTYSTTGVLAAYGPDYRFRTPVYRLGPLRGAVLTGNLVLVASGDFSFGLRDRSDETLGFNSIPEIDHNYASTGFAGAAVVKDSDPLAALDEMAAQVRRAGIRRVQGNVVIDDRLFDTYAGWPDGPIAPIWVNENVIDIFATPAGAGNAATLTWRPKINSLRVVNEVTTAARGTKTAPLSITTVSPGTIKVSGRLAAGAKPLLSTWQIPDPVAFAREAFIEALARAGVTVSAKAGGPNPVQLLAKMPHYDTTQQVAQHVSPPLSQYVKVILKVSYNRGADLMLCLVAVRKGSRDCTAGLGFTLDTISELGVSRDSTILMDGAGSNDDGRTSPADQTSLLRNLLGRPWGHYVRDGMSVMGVDGTQAMNQVGMPAAGHVHVKDGSRVVGSPDGQVYLPAKTQVGYIDAKSGRRLVYAAYVNDVPTTQPTLLETFGAVDRDVAAIAAAFQQGF